ncbi:hypothetical protein Lbru_0837 [Legionella brunensis]|uniref:Uncharacterized protein n=1 Tax=Legionella brunensis TaxID=29422 RepID=A0A0W0SSG9_9GAMM|nr:hypothetical protein Lbru_0837 [Legionella brunensis]
MIICMKVMTTLFHYIIIVSLVLFTIKPLLSYEQSKQPFPIQYTTTHSKCSSGTTTVSACQMSIFYTITEEQITKNLYLFILAGLLCYNYRQLKSTSPHSRLFKPPILSH